MASSKAVDGLPPDKYLSNDVAIHVEDPNCATSPPPSSPTKAKSNITHLFAFTPPAHVPLLVVSFTTAAVLAGSRTAYAIFLGHVFECASRFAAGVLAPDPFLSEISQWALWLTVLGAGMWAVATVDIAAWIVGGELRAKTAREQVFATLLKRNMGWFEKQGEGVGGLVVGIAT